MTGHAIVLVPRRAAQAPPLERNCREKCGLGFFLAGFPIFSIDEDSVEHGVAGFVQPSGGLFVQVALGEQSGEIQ